MPDLFGLDIAGIVDSSLKSAGGLPAATLIKVTPGTRTAGSLSGGTNPTQASYPTTGIFEPTTKGDWNGTSWDMTRREIGTVTLMGKPLTLAGVMPEAGDLVTAVDALGTSRTYSITAVGGDPAAATYSCTVAGA